MKNRLYIFVFRLIRHIETRPGKLKEWDEDHSRAVDCLTSLIEYYRVRGWKS